MNFNKFRLLMRLAILAMAFYLILLMIPLSEVKEHLFADVVIISYARLAGRAIKELLQQLSLSRAGDLVRSVVKVLKDLF